MFDQNQPEEQLRYVDTKNIKRGTNYRETEKEIKDTKEYRKKQKWETERIDYTYIAIVINSI